MRQDHNPALVDDYTTECIAPAGRASERQGFRCTTEFLMNRFSPTPIRVRRIGVLRPIAGQLLKLAAVVGVIHGLQLGVSAGPEWPRPDPLLQPFKPIADQSCSS